MSLIKITDFKSQNMFRVYRTVNKLLKNRGYQDVSQENKNFEDRDSLTILTHKINNPDDKIFVFFPTDEKVGVKPIRKYMKLMEEEDVYRSIVVVIDSVTSFAKNEINRSQIIENEDGKKIKIECFNEKELYIDITEHELVPKHILLTPEEKKELLDELKIRENQLPKIKLKTDPVARYYGLSKGDVIKIIRPSETSGEYINYRISI